jgi:hypothetical protein
MNTLEIRPYDYILWREQTPQQVRDRLYPSIQLSPMNYARGSLDPRATYCQAWVVDGAGVVLVEVP